MNILRLILSIIICHLAGVVGSVFTVSSIPTWYAGLVKPFFTPPNWLFAPVWLTLYTLMGIALYFIWMNKKRTKRSLQVFSIQLILNALWSVVFFGMQNLLLGFIVIVILWTFILLTIYYFWKIDRRAGYLLIPYIIWVTIASALNLGVLLLN